MPVVLAVEGDPVIRQQISDALGPERMEVLTAGDGLVGILVLAAFQVDAVLLGSTVTDGDCALLVDALWRSGRAHIPILRVATADDERACRSRPEHAPALTVLSDPIELIAAVRSVISGSCDGASEESQNERRPEIVK